MMESPLSPTGSLPSDNSIPVTGWTSNTMYNIPEKYVIVHPGADLIRKTWPTRSFVKIISNLEKDQLVNI